MSGGTRAMRYLSDSESPWRVGDRMPWCLHAIVGGKGSRPEWYDPAHQDCSLHASSRGMDHVRYLPSTPAGRAVLAQPYTDDHRSAWRRAKRLAERVGLRAVRISEPDDDGETFAVLYVKADADEAAVRLVARRLRHAWLTIVLEVGS